MSMIAGMKEFKDENRRMNNMYMDEQLNATIVSGALAKE